MLSGAGWGESSGQESASAQAQKAPSSIPRPLCPVPGKGEF